MIARVESLFQVALDDEVGDDAVLQSHRELMKAGLKKAINQSIYYSLIG